jgi:hypothetical protein
VARTLANVLMAIVVFGAGPAHAQNPAGAGKLEVALVPAGWLSFARPETRPEPAFGQFIFGGALTVNWNSVGIEADLLMAPGREQDLEFGATSLTRKAPHVVVDSVSLIVPVLGNRRRIVPYAKAGIGEVTVMRTSDDVLQPDTETFTSGNFGGGVKWYSAGRWGVRGDYQFAVVRSKNDAPGAFFGRELRKSHRFYGGVVVAIIR